MLATGEELTGVRLFLGKLQGVQSVLAMAFLRAGSSASWASWPIWPASRVPRSGSTLMSAGSATSRTRPSCSALSLEMAANPISPDADLFEGDDLLRQLIVAIVQGPRPDSAA